MADQFRQGQPLEIIDGDLATLDEQSLTKIMEYVQQKKEENSSLVVITVLGAQSSGKSTLLNHIFGAKFQVSDGRCTKGLNAMLVNTDLEDAKQVLVLDSEGLFSIEKGNKRYDRNLVVFCFAISNFVLINIKGELDTVMQQILKEAFDATELIAKHMESEKLPKPIFIFRDQIES